MKKLDVERVRNAVKELVRLGPEVNRLSDELRACASKIAGCALDDWTRDDLIKYIDLGHWRMIEKPKWDEAIKLAESFVKAISEVQIDEKRGILHKKGH